MEINFVCVLFFFKKYWDEPLVSLQNVKINEIQKGLLNQFGGPRYCD
jgi:hypothetical protein